MVSTGLHWIDFRTIFTTRFSFYEVFDDSEHIVARSRSYNLLLHSYMFGKNGRKKE